MGEKIPIETKCKKCGSIKRDFFGTMQDLEKECPECGGNIGPCKITILDRAIKKGD